MQLLEDLMCEYDTEEFDSEDAASVQSFDMEPLCDPDAPEELMLMHLEALRGVHNGVTFKDDEINAALQSAMASAQDGQDQHQRQWFLYPQSTIPDLHSLLPHINPALYITSVPTDNEDILAMKERWSALREESVIWDKRLSEVMERNRSLVS
jgi:hypothetical protein